MKKSNLYKKNDLFSTLVEDTTRDRYEKELAKAAEEDRKKKEEEARRRFIGPIAPDNLNNNQANTAQTSLNQRQIFEKILQERKQAAYD